jgi:SAM-dependent methyltransferase
MGSAEPRKRVPAISGLDRREGRARRGGGKEPGLHTHISKCDFTVLHFARRKSFRYNGSMEQVKAAVQAPTLEEDDHWWFATRTWAIDRWLGQLGRHSGLEILDIGCGAGNMFHHLGRYGHVKGIEIDARPVKIAQTRGYDVRQADASRGIPFDDKSFDLVTALDVIEHVDEDEAILRETCRVLKPGGHLLLTTPAFQWLWSYNDELNAHKRRYTARELRTRLTRASLTVRRISYNFFLVFPMAAGMILLRNRTRRRVELSSHHFREDAYQVEMEPVSPLLNTLLRSVGHAEGQMIGAINFPLGTSLIALAQRSI